MSHNIPTNIDNISLSTQTLLIVTLHKSKLLQISTPPSSYTLSLSFNNSSKAYTDKISSNLHTFSQSNNTFSFKSELHSLSQSTLLIQASTVWFLFNSTIAQITIPITLNNINSQRQWFYLKNEQEENIIGILISFSCNDIKVKTLMSPTINKTDLSIRYANHNYSTHYMNIHNVSVIDKPPLSNEYKRKSTFNSVSHINSNDNVIMSGYNFSGLRCKSNNNINVNQNSLLNCKDIISIGMLFELIANKRKNLLEMEDKNKIQILNNNIANDRIKDNEKILNKENTKLLERLRKNKLLQNEYETKTINLTQNALTFEKIEQRHSIINEISNYNNEYSLHLSNIYNYSYNSFHLPVKTIYISEQHHMTQNGKSFLQKPQNKREGSSISTVSNNLHIDTFSNGNIKQKAPNAILDHGTLLCHNKSNKNQRQDPAKKSNSTYMTTTQNTSEVSFNEYLINKPPMISQIYLNTSGVNYDSNIIKDNLECVTNKKAFRHKTITNHSYLNYSNLMNNGVNVNVMENNNTNTIRKSSVKGKNGFKGNGNNENHLQNNINNNQANIRGKKRKQTVISLTSHKPLNTIYNNGHNVGDLCTDTNQCSTTRKSKKHISIKKI